MPKKFAPHIDLAHIYWKNFLKKTDNAIDATCGNGHDLLFLTEIIDEGTLFAFDIQKEAIENSKKLLAQNSVTNVCFYHNSHNNFSMIKCPIHLIVYNLGYLPGGNKTITTEVNETLKSVKEGLAKVAPHCGAISITAYPGHTEGKKEEDALLLFLATLPPDAWEVRYHKWINSHNAPSLFWIQKRSKETFS